jgi:hypothetical protein
MTRPTFFDSIMVKTFEIGEPVKLLNASQVGLGVGLRAGPHRSTQCHV